MVNRNPAYPIWSVTHGMTKTTTYNTWQGLRARCENPSNKDYANYGGRGIRVCAAWEAFECFLADMGPKPPGLTIERIDNDGPYSKENCRWATVAEQNRNRRNVRRLTFRGETRLLPDWCALLGINYISAHARLRRGWTVEETLTGRRAG
jgi:hypothetical protein